MRRLANYVFVGGLAGIVGSHATACKLCYDYTRAQGYSVGSCAATATAYTVFISHPLGAIGALGGGLIGLGVGSVDYVIRKRRNDLEDKLDG